MKTNFLIMIIILQLLSIDKANSQNELRDKDIQFGANWLEEAQTTNLSEDLLTGSLLAEQHSQPLAAQFLTQAMERLEHDPLLLSTAIYHCFSNGPFDSCADNSLFEELIQLDSDNLEPYLYYMVRLIESGEEEKALRILNEGLETKLHNEYFYDKVQFLTQKFTLAGYEDDDVLYPAEVYSSVSTLYALYLKILSACPRLSISDDEWKNACLFLGARLGNSSKGFLPNVFGGAIQRDVLIAIDADPDLIQLIVDRREWDNKIRILAGEELDWWLNPLEHPESFIKEQVEIPEREAILRAIYRVQ